MKKPNVLIIADKADIDFLNTERQSEHWDIIWHVIDYNELRKKNGELQELVAKHDIDLVLYSRNDQVSNRISIGPITRKLRTGYSSFSGIDKMHRIKHMVECFDDFVECGKRLNFNLAGKRRELIEGNSEGTFSLIFDTEQLGGARYGLPRILDLLNGYNVNATFFVTNLVKKVYSNILEVIQGQGHEVGLHGLRHEYLSGLGKEEQEKLIRNMVEDFGTKVHGLNFIGRMDGNTVPALMANKLEYFVYPLINYYRLFSYPKLSTMPAFIHFPDGNIWALPVSVETYGSPWFSVRNMVDSAVSQSLKCQFPHISILCHPFRDGNLQHIKVMEKLLHHLARKGLKSITLEKLVSTLVDKQDDFSEINGWGELSMPQKRRISPPGTRQDLLGIIPQNLLNIYKMIKRGHAIF